MARRNAGSGKSRSSHLFVPALAAIGFGAGIGGPASALELGPVRMESTLGQPLRASIAFALRPHEQIASYCVSVASGRSSAGLASAGPAWVSVRDGAIHLVGERALSDPLLSLQVTVDCPYAAHLSREYVLLVDPPRTSEPDARSVRVAEAAEPAPAAVPAPAADAPVRRTAARGPAITSGSTYRVRPGDTLSGIAARLSGRRTGLWPTVERLFETNPQAFVDGNPDRLRAGAVLQIPADVYAPAAVAEVPAPARSAVAEEPAGTTAYAGYTQGAAPATAPAGTVPAAVDGDALFVDGRTAAPARIEAAPAGKPAAPQPGDVSVEAEGLFVTPIGAEPSSAPAAAAPELPARGDLPLPVRGDAPTSGALSWLVGLGGTGVALILGLLLFGRRLNERFGGGRHIAFDDDAESGTHRALDADAEHDPSTIEVDFRFDEADAGARIVRVDADLDDGSGFQETSDIDVAQDFGFSASGNLELGLDLDFSAEPVRLREGEVIVEREIPPGDPTSEYDLSMIVDATRQPLSDDEDTEKDLRAIEVEHAGSESEEDPFTLSRELDYKILEQDYEEELTATQALSKELSNAARELVEELHGRSDEGLHELPTVEMPGPASDKTAELPRRDAADGDTVDMLPPSALQDAGDTDVNEGVAAVTAAGNDASADLEIESATIDTKQLKVS